MSETETYTFHGQRFYISALACDDGDVIFTISNFPMRATLYMTAQQARYISEQLRAASERAEQNQQKEAA